MTSRPLCSVGFVCGAVVVAHPAWAVTANQFFTNVELTVTIGTKKPFGAAFGSSWRWAPGAADTRVELGVFAHVGWSQERGVEFASGFVTGLAAVEATPTAYIPYWQLDLRVAPAIVVSTAKDPDGPRVQGACFGGIGGTWDPPPDRPYGIHLRFDSYTLYTPQAPLLPTAGIGVQVGWRALIYPL